MPNTTWKFTSPDSNSSCGCKEPAPGSKIHGFRVESVQTNNRFVNNRGVVQVKLMNCETVHKQSKHGDGGTNQTNQSIADKRNDHLLVEDHADTANSLSFLLTRRGYIVSIARDVASALKLAAAQPFDLLLSDLGLPDATGYELMSQIRARHSIPGIALSGY